MLLELQRETFAIRWNIYVPNKEKERIKMKKELVDHYGNGTTNVDVKTGIIHYGVINQKEVLQVWADSSEPIYICGNCAHAHTCARVCSLTTVSLTTVFF